MKKLLIFDCDGVCWAVFHALKGKLSHNGMNTSLIYGFLSHVFAVQAYDKAEMIVFAWDSRSSKREEIFPAYKLKRKQDKENYTEEEQEQHFQRIEQVNLLKNEILPKLGFNNIFQQDGYEGDDIIAKVVEMYKGQYYIKIVARDQDLYQLIDKTVVMYDPVGGKVMTVAKIKEKYDIEPHQFRDVKAICGCTTDEVPGIYNVGEVKAIQYVKGTMKYTTKAYKAIQDGAKTIALTRALTSLPFEGTAPCTISQDCCLPNRLLSVARVYGLKSFTTDGRRNEYEQNFCIRGFDNRDTRRETRAEKNKGRMGEFSSDVSDF